MTKAFKKGDEVTYIGDWDHKGTVYYRHAVVYSCGKKQMVLTDAVTGEEMGRHFRPVVGEITGTFPRMTDEQAIAKCLEVGARIVAEERTRMERAIALCGYGEDHEYTKAVRKDIAALHEPIATSYADARHRILAETGR